MNSNHCSRWVVLLVASMLALSAVPAAAAVDVTEDESPSDVEVGSDVAEGDAVYTLTDLYSNYDQWVLTGETDLTDTPRWTITWYGQAGERLKRETVTGQSFNVTVDRNDPDVDAEPTRIEVQVEGTVPEVDNYTYDPKQSFTVAALSESPEGNSPEELSTHTATHYTAESSDARAAIDDAQAAIDDADSVGADTSTAEDSLESAISAYEAENFENAQTLAERSQSEAEQAKANKQQSEQSTTLLLYGVIGIVVLALIGGGVYWYRNQDDDYGKLS